MLCVRLDSLPTSSHRHKEKKTLSAVSLYFPPCGKAYLHDAAESSNDISFVFALAFISFLFCFHVCYDLVHAAIILLVSVVFVVLAASHTTYKTQKTNNIIIMGNIFRYLGDMVHLLAILILLGKMLRTRSAAGISLKTQFLFALVFTTRYLDLLFSYISLYNTAMKVIFIASSYHICFLMSRKNPWKATYDRENDSFRVRYLIIPCAILALLFHHRAMHEVLEIFWTFSEYLEAVAILPQIFLLEYTDRYDALTSHYIFCLGAYRVFYILNWIYRYAVEGKVVWVSMIAGTIQALLFVDFFYHYVKQVVKKAKEKYNLAH